VELNGTTYSGEVGVPEQAAVTATAILTNANFLIRDLLGGVTVNPSPYSAPAMALGVNTE